MGLKNCWEIKNCGRQIGGPKAGELGVCVAAQDGFGHSCWAIAGTLCGGKIQGTAAQKELNCMVCPVYKEYNRTIGTKGVNVQKEYPDEDARFKKILAARVTQKAANA